MRHLFRCAASSLAVPMIWAGIATTSTAVASGPSMPQVGDDLIRVYQALHAHPELSFKEVQTSRYLASELQALGFAVSTALGDAWVRD